MEIIKHEKASILKAIEDGGVIDTATIKRCVQMVYIELKRYPKNGEIDGDVMLIKKELLNFKNLRKNELEIAFNKGVRGEYGEYFGISLVTFFKWIKSYCDSQERANNITTYYKSLNAVKYPSKEQKEAIIKKGIADEFEAYRSNKRSLLLASSYDYLCKISVISYEKDDKLNFIEKAKEKLKNENDFKNASNFADRNRMKQLVAAIENKNNPELINEAKRIALADFYDSIILFDGHIDDYLKKP